MLLSIRETKTEPGRYSATLSFDNRAPYPVVVENPFSEKEEELLAWYFEQYQQFPFTGQHKSREIAKRIADYGEKLFNDFFASRKSFVEYQNAVQAVNLEIEIVGSPAFHALHWETLKDPEQAEALALHYSLVRKVWGESVPPQTGQELPTLNVLLVVARTEGEAEVGFRTISLPLVQTVQQAKLPVKIEILRPATYTHLRQHLEETTATKGKGYYHLIHFDVHGSLLTQENLQKKIESGQFTYDTSQVSNYAGEKAFLLLASEKLGKSHPVEANELAQLLTYHGIPLIILNACQSAKQRHTNTETSLGSRLSQTGAQAVVAMAYSVTVSAAKLFMEVLYQKLFEQLPLSVALRLARAELYVHKQRQARHGQNIDLEDWLLPIIYQQTATVTLAHRAFTVEEEEAYYEQQGQQYEPPPTSYEFVGRDLDVLEIENRLCTQGRMLLIQGMAGAGKTTLLHHLARWWQATQFVQQVFYFGYDAKLYTLQEVLHELARKLLSADPFKRFLAWKSPAQQAKIVEELNKVPHLLILDNVEILSASEEGVAPWRAAGEWEALHEFLRKLVGSKSVVLLGSRSEESGLEISTFADNVHQLRGLDQESASQLVDKILKRYQVTHYRTDPVHQDNFQKLLKILDGYPLALQVILANLAKQTPTDVLTALETGDLKIDFSSLKKTESLIACIDYSYRRLSVDAQKLLLCLTPFTGVIFELFLDEYTEKLQQQSTLAELPFDQWETTLQEAKNWGLLTAHPEISGFLQIHPILPYFLRQRWQPYQNAITTTFCRHYDITGSAIRQLLYSKQPEQKFFGQVMVRLEQENLWKAVTLSLAARNSFINPYMALSFYLDTTQEHVRGLALGEFVLTALLEYPTELLQTTAGIEFVEVLDLIASWQLSLKKYTQAEQTYQEVLSIWLSNNSKCAEDIKWGSASIYHQLGRVAEAQQQWEAAQEYYQQALAIKIEFNDRYAQAATYAHMGIVAQEQRQWAIAQEYYQQALAIFLEFKDFYEQGRIYHQLGNVSAKQQQWEAAQG